MGGIIKLAIERPVPVLALILITIWCSCAANHSHSDEPDIEKPVLDVRVRWNGASPTDVDRECRST